MERQARLVMHRRIGARRGAVMQGRPGGQEPTLGGWWRSGRGAVRGAALAAHGAVRPLAGRQWACAGARRRLQAASIEPAVGASPALMG